jgi:hypothetical protein
MEPEEMYTVKKRLSKQVSSATDTEATIKKLLRTVFYVRSMQSCCKEEFI